MAFLDRDKVKMTLHLNRDFFIPGETLRGRLHLAVKKSVTLTAVRLHMDCKEKALERKHSRNRTLEEFTHFSKMFTFFGEAQLTKRKGVAKLMQGEYDYPFQIDLPSTLPPSLYCTVRRAKTKIYYYVEANIIIPNGLDGRKRQYITVLPAARRDQWTAVHAAPTSLTGAKSGADSPDRSLLPGGASSLLAPYPSPNQNAQWANQNGLTTSPSGDAASGALTSAPKTDTASADADGAVSSPPTAYGYDEKGGVDEIAAEKARLKHAEAEREQAAAAAAAAAAVPPRSTFVVPKVELTLDDAQRLPVRGGRFNHKEAGYLELGVKVLPAVLALSTRAMFPSISALNAQTNTRANRDHNEVVSDTLGDDDVDDDDDTATRSLREDTVGAAFTNGPAAAAAAPAPAEPGIRLQASAPLEERTSAAASRACSLDGDSQSSNSQPSTIRAAIGTSPAPQETGPAAQPSDTDLAATADVLTTAAAAPAAAAPAAAAPAPIITTTLELNLDGRRPHGNGGNSSPTLLDGAAPSAVCPNGAVQRVPSAVRAPQFMDPASPGLRSPMLPRSDSTAATTTAATVDDRSCLFRLTLHNGTVRKRIRYVTVTLMQLLRFDCERCHTTKLLKLAKQRYVPPTGPLLPGQTITIDVPLEMPQMLRVNGQMNRRLPLPTVRTRSLEVVNVLDISFKGLDLQHAFTKQNCIDFVTAVDEQNVVPTVPAVYVQPLIFPEEIVGGHVY